MSLIELVLIAIGLAMDAFAVSICKGLTLKKLQLDKAILCGLYFGGFQALMPIIGYFLGYGFRDYIEAYDHWIAFVLLAAIGISTIRGAQGEDEDESDIDQDSNLYSDNFSFKSMLPLAVATSIDALAVGVSLAFLKVNIWKAAGLIGIITFVIAMLGVKIGQTFGFRFKKKAELAGGIILILIGFKILVDHLGILGAGV